MDTNPTPDTRVPAHPSCLQGRGEEYKWKPCTALSHFNVINQAKSCWIKYVLPSKVDKYTFLMSRKESGFSLPSRSCPRTHRESQLLGCLRDLTCIGVHTSFHVSIFCPFFSQTPSPCPPPLGPYEHWRKDPEKKQMWVLEAGRGQWGGKFGDHVWVVGGLRALGHHAPLTLQTFHHTERSTAEDGQGRAHEAQGLAGALLHGSQCTECKILHNWSKVYVKVSFLCRKGDRKRRQKTKSRKNGRKKSQENISQQRQEAG